MTTRPCCGNNEGPCRTCNPVWPPQPNTRWWRHPTAPRRRCSLRRALPLATGVDAAVAQAAAPRRAGSYGPDPTSEVVIALGSNQARPEWET